MADRSRFPTDAGTIRAVVRSVLEETVCRGDAGDAVVVEPARPGLRVAYAPKSDPHDAAEVTRLECRVDLRGREMWIDDVRVAPSLRSKGIGRRLVAAAERIARALGLRTVCVFPLASAKRFWAKMGYAPHPKMARVVTKDPHGERLPATGG